jgi:hypothetical protein
VIVLLTALSIVTAACTGDSERPSRPEPGNGEARDTSTAQAAPEGKGDFPTSFQADWNTNFNKASVSSKELTRGQVKDGIPAISQPKFLGVEQVSFLGDKEPVVAFELDGKARAYPLQILIWHEIVNDVVAGRPVLITFCPLCNTAIAFDRIVSGRTLEFGVSGFLRNSDLVMFDRQTESWWQQVTGEALVGDFTGTRLELLASSIVAWSDFKAAFPDGKVLSRETGHRREYGNNPYVGYDDVRASPFLFDGKTDGRLAAMERVVAVELAGQVVAYPFSRLEKQPVVADDVGGVPIVVLFKRGTASALDRSTINDSRDIGSAAVFKPVVDGRTLTFRVDGRNFVDNETGSRWDIFGRSTAGALKGKVLEAIVSGNHFWFAWAAFKPETRVWSP